MADLQVMIVHVNPYDTGFDENSHVMRFSAIAREIQTTASNKVGFPLLKRQISTQFSALRQAVSGPMKVKVVVPVLPRPGSAATSTARLGIQQGQGQGTGTGTGGESSRRERESDGFVMVEEEIEVVEEDGSEDEDEDDETDWMVEHLFEQLKEIKQRVSHFPFKITSEADDQLYESEMRNATIESEVREEAAQEMQEALQRMHADFSKMFQDQVRLVMNLGNAQRGSELMTLARSVRIKDGS
jgi:kinesin family protein 20